MGTPFYFNGISWVRRASQIGIPWCPPTCSCKLFVSQMHGQAPEFIHPSRQSNTTSDFLGYYVTHSRPASSTLESHTILCNKPACYTQWGCPERGSIPRLACFTQSQVIPVRQITNTHYSHVLKLETPRRTGYATWTVESRRARWDCSREAVAVAGGHVSSQINCTSIISDLLASLLQGMK